MRDCMITGSQAFHQILDALVPALVGQNFELFEAGNDPHAFGSQFASFSDGSRFVRLTWHGKGHFFVLEGDNSPEWRPPSGQPVWLDLTLQRFNPTEANQKWVSEIIEDVTKAFHEFCKADKR